MYNGNLYDKIYIDSYDKEIQSVMNLRTKAIEDLSRLNSSDFQKNIILIIDEANSYLKLLRKSQLESEKMIDLIKKK